MIDSRLFFKNGNNNSSAIWFSKTLIHGNGAYSHERKNCREYWKLLALALFLDLRKAFDTVQHHILIEKLEMYGIRDVALNFMKNYLINRYQCISVNGISSIQLRIQYGVPQGSILWPLLFLIYVNNITQIPGSSELTMYADNRNVFFTEKNCRMHTTIS